MRPFIGTLIANSEILPGVHLLEVEAAPLARAAQPGQYCMLRGCDSQASDPLLRRPFFVAEINSEHATCRFIVYRRGRASSWLARQQPGMSIDLLGPLGHGWMLRPEARNLLLIGEDPLLPALLALANQAIERELAVTLIHCVVPDNDLPHKQPIEGYPAPLLPPELEYQVFPHVRDVATLATQLNPYLDWADTVCCSVSANLLAMLTQVGTRWREKHFAQASTSGPLYCVTGTCLACQVETRHGSRLACRAGPIFALRDLLGE